MAAYDRVIKLAKDIKKILKEQNSPIRSCVAAQCSPHQNVSTIDSFSDMESGNYVTRRSYIPFFNSHSQMRFPLVIFFHGGGFVKNSCTSAPYDEFCRRLAVELPCVVISVNYPLAPKFKCPVQYDVAEEYFVLSDKRWPSANSLCKYADNSNVYLMGDDAGGNIVHHLATLIASGEVMLVNYKIKGIILIQPFFGGEERTKSEEELSKCPMLTLKQMDKRWKQFLPDKYDRDYDKVNVSGSYSFKVSLERFPRTLVIIGGWDPLQDRQRQYCKWLRRSGAVNVELKEYSKTMSQFYLYPELPQSTCLMDDIRSFVSTPV